MNGFISSLLLLFKPFEIIIEIAYRALYSLVGEPGWTLVLVSAVITFGTAPLYTLADRWKQAEGVLQKRMKRDLDSIRSNYSGQKRFYMIRTAHRIYRYKWWHSLRTSFGLFIQIPFFFAAINVISGRPEFSGNSFLGIGDLSAPDALLSGINVLPFIMTAINICLAFYYSGTASLKQNRDFLLMAAVFLVLLYNSPAALLVYWTMNNIWSFLRTFLFRKIGWQPSPDPEPETKGVDIHDFIARNLQILITSCQFFAASLTVWSISAFDEYFKYIIVVLLCISFVLTAVVLFVRKSIRRFFPLVPVCLALVPLLYMLLFFRNYNPLISNPNLKLCTAFLLELWVFGCIRLLLLPNIPESKVEPLRLRGFFMVAISVSFFVLLYLPAKYYVSTVSDMGFSPGYLFTWLIMLFAAFLGVALVAYRFARPGFRSVLSIAMVFCFLVIFVYSVFLPLDTGMLDSFVFQNEAAINRIPLLAYLADAVIISALLFLAEMIVRSYRQSIVLFSCALVAVFFGHLLILFNGIKTELASQSVMESVDMPSGAMDNHVLSSNGTNVVFILADMFNGNYLGDFLDEDPDLAARMAGFEWYRDSLSVSYNTASSLPAMLGGTAFEPRFLDGNGFSGKQEIQKAADRFFSGFIDNGFTGTINNPLYIATDMYQGLVRDDLYAYVPYWRQRNGIASERADDQRIQLLLMLSIFNASPWHMRYPIYDDGSWIIFRSGALFDYMRNRAIRESAYLDLLPELCTVQEAGNRLLYIHNELPHTPYGIAPDGEPVRNTYPDEEKRSFTSAAAARYSAKKQLTLMLKWVDWFREAGIFDNTLFVIVSDHGNPFEDNGIVIPSELRRTSAPYDLSRAHSLILIKRPFSVSDFSVNDLPVTSSDIPALISEATGSSLFPETGNVQNYGADRFRVYSSIATDWENFLQQDSLPWRHYRFDGPLDAPSAWSVFRP